MFSKTRRIACIQTALQELATVLRLGPARVAKVQSCEEGNSASETLTHQFARLYNFPLKAYAGQCDTCDKHLPKFVMRYI